LQAEAPSLTEYLEQVRARPVARVPGSAVFMNRTASRTPQAFHHNLEHNKVLHERVVFVTVKTGQTPFVNESDRIEIESFGDGFPRVRVYCGYMEQPDVPKALAAAAGRGLPPLNPAETTYFLGRETIVASRRPGMARWREHLFSLMSRNATTATAYFG